MTRAAQQVYGALAPDYDRRWTAYVARTTSWALGLLQVTPHARILDVGCGTGVLLEQLLAAEPTVRAVGVDATHAMLAMARGRLPSVSLVQASGTALPLPDAAFDRVVSTSALHYVHDPAAMLAELRRVLAPHGVVVISDWCGDYWLMRLLDVALRSVLRFLDPAHHRVLRGAELERLLRDVGFRQVTIERRKIDRFWGIMSVRAQ